MNYNVRDTSGTDADAEIRCTATPNAAHKLGVAGSIRSSSGGFVFPDGTIQTTAAAGGGSSITAVNAGSDLTGWRYERFTHFERWCWDRNHGRG
jgi:hypothetical protein